MLPLAITACTSSSDEDTSPHTGFDCMEGALLQFPEDDERLAATLVDEVWLAFSTPPDSTALRVHDVTNGEDASGEVLRDGNDLLFRPSSPFTPLTRYETLFDAASCPTSSARWATTGDGLPIELSDIVGQSWVVGLDRNEKFNPTPGALLLHAPTTTDLVVAGGEDGIGWVPYCSEAIAAGLTTDNPQFSADLGAIAMRVGAHTYLYERVELQGVFGVDGARLFDVRLWGRFDVRSYGDEPAEETCALSAAQGDPCGPCESDGEPFCVDFSTTGEDNGRDVEPKGDYCDRPECAEHCP